MQPKDLMPMLSAIPDPRTRKVDHKLENILVMALGAILAGCSDFVAIEQFCSERKKVFSDLFGIVNVPSHDTFNRIFRLIDSSHFESVFRCAVAAKIDLSALGDSHVAIDGKAQSRAGIHAVSAWSSTRGVCLGTEHTPHGKGSELASMVALVEALDLKRAVVTVDAMGCNDKMAKAIVAGGGHYAMQVTANQKLSESWIQDWFDKNQDKPDHVQEPSKERLGVVSRECFVLSDPRKWAGQGVLGFEGAASVCMLKKTFQKAGQADAVEKRYYVSSIVDPARLAESIRAHWSVENSLHWTLDVQFGEDANLVRDKNAQKNLGLIRKIAINAYRNKGVKNFKKHMFGLLLSNDKLMGALLPLALDHGGPTIGKAKMKA